MPSRSSPAEAVRLGPGTPVAAVIGWMIGREAPRNMDRAREIAEAEPHLGFWGRFRRVFAALFSYTESDGRRHVDWRTRRLLLLLSGLFALATLWLAVEAATVLRGHARAEATVARVFAHEGWAPWSGAVTEYVLLLQFDLKEGGAAPVLAPTHLRHPDWNFPPGTRLTALYDTAYPNTVWLPGAHNWVLPGLIGGVAVLLALPAALMHRRILRWQRTTPEGQR